MGGDGGGIYFALKSRVFVEEVFESNDLVSYTLRHSIGQEATTNAYPKLLPELRLIYPCQRQSSYPHTVASEPGPNP